MCGIAGFWSSDSTRLDQDAKSRLKAMTDSIDYRGPDSSGAWFDEQAGLALGHRRLSILDLSPAGSQPMLSHGGRYVIAYNGEIYNFEELRKKVEAHHGKQLDWRGHSDTEVILESVEAFGLKATLEELIGMFAFALWDRKERTLSLARDRFGIKPLYYGRFGSDLIFASELKPFRKHPAFKPEIDRKSLTSYIYFSHVPDPMSIYKGIQKLEPGAFATLKSGTPPKIERFWSAFDIALNGLTNRITDEREGVARMHDLLRDAIKRRMVADVPLGAFLSGGIDSSLVVALMQEASISPVKTFSIGFHESEYNEAPFAKAVAEHLKTDHTELYVTPEEAQAVIPLLPKIYDEPFADSSQVPTYLVSKLARRHVTITLSGDGGDEVFAGYGRYFQDIPNGDLYLRQAMTFWQEPEKMVHGGNLPPVIHRENYLEEVFQDKVERFQFIDTVTYLPGDILTKVDRASMAVSLEARPPLLDHRIYELAWRLPPEIRRAHGKSKWPLRSILYKYIPKEYIERPKMGFGVPIDHWLRGPLRDWCENLLNKKRLREEGYFNVEMIRSTWEKHLAGEGWHYWLWVILMFQAWKDRQDNLTHST